MVVWLTTNLSSTGDQDSCFYNFSCLRPWGTFLPFNAVFSNIGYVVAGQRLPAASLQPPCSSLYSMQSPTSLATYATPYT